MFDDNIRGALNLHSFSWQLKQYIDDFHENMGKAEHDYAVNPTGGDRGDLVYRIGYALMRTDRNPLRTELYNIVNDALQAYLEPAFEQSQLAILYHMDYLIAQIEQRYAPLQQEVEELRREVRRLKDEDTDSVRPALRTAVED
ncbi:MAG: hypothetical protein DRP83_00220 [Planctomycetota bacterium]|nr:MAG: hypothetical protein DRP83_00220 [Planctomycetota bacterium]